jgi:hypothetical protein
MTLPSPYWRVAPALAALTLVALASAQAAAGPPPPVPRSSDMILPLAEVQAIVKEPELEAKSINDRTSPWVDHSQDSHLSAPCRRFLNQDEEFGDTWINFKSAGYSGESNIGIHQHIAVYPDTATAQRVFRALKTAAQQCRKHYPTDLYGLPYTLTEQAPDTLLVQYPDSVNGPGSVTIDALRGQVIIGVGAAHFSTDPTIAQTVLAHITRTLS